MPRRKPDSAAPRRILAVIREPSPWTKPVQVAMTPQHIMRQSQPAAGAEPVQGQVAGYLEGDVAGGEDAGDEAEGGAAQPEVGVHGQGSGTHVDAVQEGSRVHEQHQEHKAPGDLAQRAAALPRCWPVPPLPLPSLTPSRSKRCRRPRWTDSSGTPRSARRAGAGSCCSRIRGVSPRHAHGRSHCGRRRRRAFR